jgi:hypothetical protein
MDAEGIVLSRQMASDFEGELEELADFLRESLPDLEVEIRDPTTAPPGSFGPEAVEVLTVILPTAVDSVVGVVIGVIVEKVRGALRKHRRSEPPSKIVRIYGPRGEVLSILEIDDPEADQAM